MIQGALAYYKNRTDDIPMNSKTIEGVCVFSRPNHENKNALLITIVVASWNFNITSVSIIHIVLIMPYY